MATRKNINLEWLNHNSQRKYPLAAAATGADVGGDFKLPNSFLLSVYLPVSSAASINPGGFFVKTVAAYGSGYTLTIGYQPSVGAAVVVAAASVPRSGHQKYDSYALRGLGDFYDSVGRVVIGDLAEINEQPAGQWEFSLATGRLELDAIRPQLRGVSQLRVQNGSDVSDPIVGDVVLRAGRNFRITPVVGSPSTIQFDAIDGEGLNESCVCVGDAAEAPAIRTINGISPTADGNFTLSGNDCLSLQALTNGLQANDNCSEPCCGCNELEVITEAMQLLGSQVTTLNTFLTNLEARVSQMDAVVLGSRLGDGGCAPCE